MDNFTADISTESFGTIGTTAGATSFTATLSGYSFPGVSSAITFRPYAYGSSAVTEAGRVDATTSECSNAAGAYGFETSARPGLYRLAMHDVSGSTNYSRALSLSITAAETGTGSIRIYPSPPEGALQVEEGLQTGSTCRILDATGHTVMAWTAARAAENVAVGTLPAGVYLLVSETAGTRLAQRLFFELKLYPAQPRRSQSLTSFFRSAAFFFADVPAGVGERSPMPV